MDIIKATDATDLTPLENELQNDLAQWNRWLIKEAAICKEELEANLADTNP